MMNRQTVEYSRPAKPVAGYNYSQAIEGIARTPGFEARKQRGASLDEGIASNANTVADQEYVDDETSQPAGGRHTMGRSAVGPVR